MCGGDHKLSSKPSSSGLCPIIQIALDILNPARAFLGQVQRGMKVPSLIEFINEIN